MGNERRNAVALDDAYFYCRQLETRAEGPDLFKLCNAIRTLDIALDAHDESPLPMTLCVEAWSRVRHSLFNILVSSFSGYIFVYDQCENVVEPGIEWPDGGYIEFYPERINRKNEAYRGSFSQLQPSILMPIRWAFAEGRQQLAPADFRPETSEEDAARDLLDRLNIVCEEEASEGKKKAHRKWWQLYWEANSCPNKRRKHELQKQLVLLQSIWGTPAT